MENQKLFNLNASFNEYAFARMVEDYNTNAFEQKKPLIRATQGRQLREEIGIRLTGKTAKNGASYTMATAPRSVLMDTVNEACREIIGGNMVEHNAYDSQYKSYLQEYVTALKWSLSGEAAERRRQYGDVPKGGYLAISPFDPRFAHRSVVLNHGTEILWAKADDLLKFASNVNGNGYHPEYTQSPENEGPFSFFSKQFDYQGQIQYRNAGSMYGQEDKNGLARLRPYISESDYREIGNWMNVDEKDRMTQEGMDRGAAILRMLQENGIPYSVSRDKNPGQLKVDVSNTKISIRLTETRHNESFIGRTYKDGYSMYLVRPGKRNEPAYVPTVNETLRMVQYAIGQHPERIRTYAKSIGKTIGSLGTTNGQNRISYMSRDQKSENKDYVLTTMVGFTEKAVGVNAKGEPDHHILMLRTTNSHSDAHLSFNTKEQAEEFLRSSVDSARANFEKEVNLDYLLQEAELHKDEEGYVPMLSGNASIAPIQQTYWDVLSGKTSLYRPDDVVESDELRGIYEALGLLDDDVVDEEEVSTVKTPGGSLYNEGSAEANVRAHLKDSMNLLFGQYQPDTNGIRFAPAMVSAFMDSPFGVYRNNDNLVAAMYKMEFEGDELRGSDFQTGLLKDKLLRFHQDSAVPMNSLDSPFMQSMFDTIKSSIEETACKVKPEDILIDSNGVVHYTAYQMIGMNGKGQQKIEGELGQIFEPDYQGVVETHYNGSENKLFTPGYDAYIIPETPETVGKDLMERVRLRGLEQTLKQNIAETIRYDLIGRGSNREFDEDGNQRAKTVGMTTSVNNTYRGLYGTSYKVSIERQEGESLKDAYIRQAELTHLPREILDARFETAKGLMHFSKDIAENSTVAAEYFHNMRQGDSSVHDLTNDNRLDAFELTGRSNMAITQNHSEGYTDPVLTGSGKNQGIVRYLVEGAVVMSDGKILPSDDKTARAPLMTTSAMRYCEYIPADRVQMVGSNYLTASGVAGMESRKLSDGRDAKGVGMAQLTLQGYTFDDGAVISSDFAKRYGVVSEDGEIRPLQAGDKICDFAGNKSIVAKVIDRDMDLDTADEMGIYPAVKLFKDNPDLDVVQAPYSAVSRFNAASAKLLMEQTSDLTLPDGTVKEGCIGFAPVIITHHTAHEHTKQYDEDDVRAGKGRKISAQLAWAFCAKGAKNIMDEVFSGNNSAVSNLREILNTMGLDMDETGTLRMGYEPHVDEERYVFHLPDADLIENTSVDELVSLFKESVGSRGGFLEIPFEMTLPSGEKTKPLQDEGSAYGDHPMYALPVMSAHLRSGQTFEDGTVSVHDYTNHYVRVFKSCLDYLKAEKEDNQTGMMIAKSQAEVGFGSITESLRKRKFDTKHNIMRDDIMAHRVERSATAIWTPDTNLELNEIGMNPSMMKKLGLKEGDYTLIWRDPILKSTGAKYMKVYPDDNLTGISVHPLVAVDMDGDFDGDSVGVHTLRTQAAKQDAMEKFSMEYTLLNPTKVRENGDFALILNDSMDLISAEYADEQKKAEALAQGKEYGPTLKERRMDLEHRVNEAYRANADLETRQSLLGELNEYVWDALNDTCGTEVVSYKDLQSHAQSLIDMVDHGAKGSHKKLASYFKYFGADFDMTDDGHIMASSMHDVGHTLATSEDVADTELATAIKSHGTGNAGAVSQKVVMALRNQGTVDFSKPENCMKDNTLDAGLRATYLTTQGLLQAKHDPIQAKRLYDMVQEPIRNIWRGRAMERKEITDDAGVSRITWVPAKEMGQDGPQFRQASKDEWIAMFMELHEHSDGLDLKGAINIDHVKRVADVLYNPDTNRMYDIEDEKTIMKLASPMDILAYRTKGAFDTLCEMAKDGRNLFEGEYNQMFAPRQIRENMKSKVAGDGLKPIFAKESMANFDPVKPKQGAFEVNTATAAYANAMIEDARVNTVTIEHEADVDKEAAVTDEKSVQEMNDMKQSVFNGSFDLSANISTTSHDDTVIIKKNSERVKEQIEIEDGIRHECESMTDDHDDYDGLN